MHTVTNISVTAAALIITVVGVHYISTHIDSAAVLNFFRSFINR